MTEAIRTVEVAVAPADARREVLEILFLDQPDDDRQASIEAWLAEAGREPALTDGLLVASRRGRLVGAIQVRPQPGNTAIVWPAVAAAPPDDAVGIALVEAAAQHVADRGIRLAQTLLDMEAADQAMWLLTAGFERAATLTYLATDTARVPDEPPTGLSFVPFDDDQTDRLAAIVEQTYDGTLDCPQLNGVRTTQEVLAGYRATGQFSPARWLIVRHDQRDIGCLLLTDHPDPTSPELSSWELVYMGLIPAARGHGWSLSIARHGIRLAAAAGRSTIALAVDEANSPALATYARAGFCHLGHKAVFLKVTNPQR